MKAPAKHSLRLTLLTLGLVLSHSGWAARLALVIGNDSYQKVEPLKNARNDARLMAGILKQAGFDVTQASDLNRESLWTTIDTFKGRISKGDEVVFYFAGHGVQIGANQLLLATDIPADNEAQVVRNGVPLIDVQDALKDARVAVLLLDACRDNPFPKTGTRTIGGTRGLSPPEPSTGQIIMMSAGRNQKALDRVPGEPQANGLFTWELSQVLKTPGVEIRTALEQVKERVDDKARKAGHEQRPSLVNDLRGNFYLLASVRPEPNPNPAIRPSLPGPAQGSGLSLDDLEREEATRKEWAQWQARMKADFDKTAAFKGSADLQAKAWERFLAAWGQDNPLSGEDEGLRAQAQGRMQERQQEAQRLAAVAPAPAPVTPAPTAPTVTAQPAQPGQAFRDCTGEHCPELVVIPAGGFVMGSNERDSEKPPHSVSVRSFALGKFEVTQGQWKAVMGNNPSYFNDCGDNCPVENVSWDDIQQYLAKLNGMTGIKYRLASEAEWEYAARAGCSTAFNVGGQCKDKIEASEANFNFDGYRRRTIQVGSFKANNWGLHDMHGNVWEWVEDVWHDSYAGAPTDGSEWKSGGDRSRRVLRGGSWGGEQVILRSAIRSGITSDRRDIINGFRIARTVP